MQQNEQKANVLDHHHGIDTSTQERAIGTSPAVKLQGEVGKHDWCIGEGCEDGYPVFVDDRQLSYRATTELAQEYALSVIADLQADGDYRLNDRPSGFLPPKRKIMGEETPRTAADDLTIAYMGMGFSAYCHSYHKKHNAFPDFCGQLEAVSEVIQHALLADRVADYFDRFEGHPGVFVYEVAEPFGLELAAMLHSEGSGLADDVVQALLRRIMTEARYPQEEVDRALEIAGSSRVFG